jgi:hypothetical protein
MDAELKARWLQALRSGEYVQDSGSLRTSNGYCCLGVLCEVAGLGHLDEKGNLNNEVVEFGLLPKSVALVSDIHPSPTIVYDGKTIDLWRLNDGHCTVDRAHSFIEIADLIEQQY